MSIMAKDEAPKFVEYPKWVDSKNEIAKTKDGKPIYERVLVQDADEEAEVTGKTAAKKDWGKKE
jgi:hypothetical protein